MTKNELTIGELQDFSGTLEEFKEIVDKLVIDYGKQSLIHFDAGYNNINVIVATI